MSDAELH